MVRKIRENWYFILIGLFMACAAVLYAVCGESAHISVHDNLDLFQAQYQMLKNTDTFFSHGSAAPFLGGISRDTLPSELSLSGLVYFLLPSFTAYIVLYFVKIAIAMVSFYLLAREILLRGRTNASGFTAPERGIVVLCGFAYGILNLFPAFGVEFASIPLALWLMLRLCRAEKRRETALCVLGMFCYPFLSYFSYFGFFLLGYFVLAFPVLWICRRRFPGRLLLGTIAMGAGTVLFEYRLFSQMLFSDVVTIRSTMEAGDLTGREVAAEIVDVFRNGMMHADCAHTKLVLPVCLFYFLFLNVRYLVSRQWKKIFTDLYNLIILLLVFNSVVYGLYNYAPFRSLFEAVLPPLKGFQFNRTVFFNPLLWYGGFFLLCFRLCRFGEYGITQTRRENSHAGNRFKRLAMGAARTAAPCLCLAAAAVVLLTANRYNDLRSTAKAAYLQQKGVQTDDLSYQEFYSMKLFDRIKNDLHYNAGDFSSTDGMPETVIESVAEAAAGNHTGAAALSTAEGIADNSAAAGTVTPKTSGQGDEAGHEWAVAYGLHPAVLEYNGIATLDGYLGFYPQSYKDAFREVIAPSLDLHEATRIYYDSWGARCYLCSGYEDTIVQAVRNYHPADDRIAIDSRALADLGCKYVFSRIDISNAAEEGLTKAGSWTDASSPYTIYVYTING